VSEQKLAATMQRIIRDQGGTVTEDPSKSDLVLSVRLETATEEKQRVEMVTQRSRAVGIVRGPLGWSFGHAAGESEVPVVMTDKVGLALVSIDLFIPTRDGSGTDEAFGIRHAWHGTLQIGRRAFEKENHRWLNYLFEQLGEPDGRQVARF